MSAALGLITVRSETPQHRMMAEREREAGIMGGGSNKKALHQKI